MSNADDRVLEDTDSLQIRMAEIQSSLNRLDQSVKKLQNDQRTSKEDIRSLMDESKKQIQLTHVHANSISVSGIHAHTGDLLHQNHC